MFPCTVSPFFPVSMFSQTENITIGKTATSLYFLQMKNENGKLPFIWCKGKRKTEVFFPWSANDKW
jgi:hypothetical protein